jgi:hypothetical protein
MNSHHGAAVLRSNPAIQTTSLGGNGPLFQGMKEGDERMTVEPLPTSVVPWSL